MLKGIIDRIRKLRQNNMVILMYRQVCNRRCDPWEFTVHPHHFYDQMEYLKKNFNVVPISALADGLRAARKFSKTVAITFDDGFKDNYTNAAPLLDWHALPATFFVATNAAQQRHVYWWDALQEIVFHTDVLPRDFEITIGSHKVRFTFEHDRNLNARLRNQIRSWNHNQPVRNERIALYRLLCDHIRCLHHTEQQNVLAMIQQWSGFVETFSGEGATMSVREIQILADNPLFSIGAHTVHHPMLSTQSVDDQAFELRESKRAIEQWLGKTVDGFAYPYGNFNGVTQALLKRTGFQFAVSTEGRPVTPEDDIFALPRIQVKNWCVYEFASRLKAMVGE